MEEIPVGEAMMSSFGRDVSGGEGEGEQKRQEGGDEHREMW
jgi:hypothetical protein